MQHRKRNAATALMAAWLCASLGCASYGWLPWVDAIEIQPPPAMQLDPEPYVIGATDRVRITVWRNPELSISAVVRTDGKISVPLIDDVQAEGLTPEELKEVVAQSLAEYVSTPDVTVIVEEMNHRTVSVVGAVGRSSRIPLQRHTRVLDAIALSGGFTQWAKTRRVRILRPNGTGMSEYRFDYRAFLAGKAPESNMLLLPGDTIVVPD